MGFSSQLRHVGGKWCVNFVGLAPFAPVPPAQKQVSSLTTDSVGNGSGGRREALRDVVGAFSSVVTVGGPSTSLFGSGVAHAAGPAPSKWRGSYQDPKHVGCKREVIVGFDGKKAKLVGRDNTKAPRRPGSGFVGVGGDQASDDCSLGDTERQWTLPAKLESPDADDIVIDFTSEGGSKDVIAKWTGEGIAFPDGTVWSKVR